MAPIPEEQNKNWISSKFKMLVHQRTLSKKITCKMGENYLQTISDRVYYPEYLKNYQNQTRRRKTTQSKSWQKISRDISAKIQEWSTST